MFVYYDVPFYAYQQKIISFAVVACMCLFVNAAVDRSAVPTALGVTVLGLGGVNGSDALGSVLECRSTLAYWLQAGLIAAYFGLLPGLYAAGGQPC